MDRESILALHDRLVANVKEFHKIIEEHEAAPLDTLAASLGPKLAELRAVIQEIDELLVALESTDRESTDRPQRKKIREFYVAFSIHGTDRFITANKVLPVTPDISLDLGSKITLDGFNFTISRPRVGNSQRNAVKLLWHELNKDSHAAGPSTDPNFIYHQFMQLRKAGWNVDDANFVKYHFPSDTEPGVSAAPKKLAARKRRGKAESAGKS